MKKLLPPIAILLALFAFSAWNGAAMERAASRWQEQLSRSAGLGRQEQWDSAAAVLEESYQDWTRHQSYLHIVSEHDVVDGAEAMYRRAMAFAEAREPSEFQAEMADLGARLSLLAEMERLSIKNIL